MNEKINLQSLIDSLAKRQGLTKKEAEAFVKEFFALIEQGLEKDSYVKIKGLGTFKLIGIENRESVNVNTGERFEIPGYTKISFTADVALKDLINKPFAHFETIVLNDDTVLEDTVVGEIGEVEQEEPDVLVEELPETVDALEVDTLPEVVDTPEVDTLSEVVDAPEEETQEGDVVANPVIIQSESESAEPIKPQIIVEPEAKDEENIEAENLSLADRIIARELANSEHRRMVAEKKVPVIENQSEEKELQPLSSEEVRSKKASGRFWVFLIVIVLMLGGGVVYVFNPDIFSPSKDPNQASKEQGATPQDTLKSTADSLINAVKKKMIIDSLLLQNKEGLENLTNETKKESVSAPPSTAEKPVPYKTSGLTRKYKMQGSKAIHTIASGETLRIISLKYYGTKEYWAYIVEYNRDVVPDPDNVPVGTQLKIPELVEN